MNIIFQKYFFLLLFLFSINNYIESKNQRHLNSILSAHPDVLFRKYKNKNSNKFNMSYTPIISFNNKNNSSTNDAEKWIKENTVAFILILTSIVVVIAVIIILIFICRKFNKKYKALQDQINKISFQSGIRESKENENEDQLI